MRSLPENLPVRFREIVTRQGRQISEKMRRQHIDAWLANGTLPFDPDIPEAPEGGAWPLRRLLENIRSRFLLAIRLARSFGRHAADGFSEATGDLQERRQAICVACPEFQTDHSCGVCGCNLKIKTQWKTSECPQGKW